MNVVGGVKVGETGADLALLLALISSFRNRPLPQDLVVFGEVGLAGEIRPVTSGQNVLVKRQNMALNVRSCLSPINQKRGRKYGSFTVKKLSDALAILDNF